MTFLTVGSSYWDWSLDWENITQAPVWDSSLGFGGNGDTNIVGFRGFCVTDGPFAGLMLPFVGPMSVPHCLSRGFLRDDQQEEYSRKLKPTAIEELLEILSYQTFNEALETGAHSSLPHIIHGDFSASTAPQVTVL